MAKLERIPQRLFMLILLSGILRITASDSVCTPSCRNGGVCIFYNVCQCPKNFAGKQCQYSVDRCAPQKIGFNGSVRCIGTSTAMNCTLSCPSGVDFDSPPASVYTCLFERGVFTPSRVPKCNYGTGVEVVQRTVEGDYDDATCNPTCKNGGTCIFRDMCQCTRGYAGPQCQYSVDRCAMQKIGFNGAIKCTYGSTEMRCTLSCPPGVEIDSPPAAAYVCRFETGSYLPARVPQCLYDDGVQVVQRIGGSTFSSNSGSSSQPTCSPRCMNGGSCIFHNLCQCAKDYRGPQCQYSVERCSIRRTGFNGGYRCSSSSTESNCTINCPDGTDHEFSPAATYRCRYATGRFEPSAIPKCVARIPEDVEFVRVAST